MPAKQVIQLSEVYNPGSKDSGNTYPYVVILEFRARLTANRMEILCGYLNQDGLPGKETIPWIHIQDIPERLDSEGNVVVEAQLHYSALQTAMPANGDEYLWYGVGRVLYDWVIANVFPGTKTFLGA